MSDSVRHITEQIEKYLMNFSLKKKLRIFYIVCVIFPLMLTDGFILHSVFTAGRAQQQHDMENLASALQYYVVGTFEQAAATADTLNLSSYIENFLEKRYETPLDYVTEYQEFMNQSFLGSSINSGDVRVTIYADNNTLVNGGRFGTIDKIRDTTWYQTLKQDDRDAVLLFYYDDWQSPAVAPKRKILFLRKMNFAARRGCEKVIKLEINYSKVIRDIDKMNYELPVFICKDGKVLLSNTKDNYLGQDFSEFTMQKNIGYVKDISLYGDTYQIYVLRQKDAVWKQLAKNVPLLFFLIFINTLLPFFLMTLIERSVTVRIAQLGKVFDSVDSEKLIEIKNVQGDDEISQLMHNYNRMADRTNGLIQTVYKDKLREREMSLAKKNAELLALHVQINPHFLFNALESIRMHSILKEEFETADMVERLAIMERQNVDWGNDDIPISREMDFVEAYLGLQKYRFGDRLSYSVSVEPDCENICIPKLSVVTFVENACVHGIESKSSPGWIFVRIYEKNENLYIEIEDTGNGMSENEYQDLQNKMQNASIEMLKVKGRVGVINACLRLKIVSDDKVKFTIEGEEGVGTMVMIQIPAEYV